MVFSSTVFLLIFLPVVAGIYYVCPRPARNTILLLASLLFYGWGEPKYIVIMLFSTVFDYTNARLIGHFQDTGRHRAAKAVLIVDVVGNLGILGFFKYTDFAITNINSLLSAGIPALGLSLPIGISFYTFQTMSYTIDVYRGDARAQRNILNFGTFVTLFPQLVAGPIIKYKDLGEQIDHRDYRVDRFASGVEIFTIGLAKKLLLANNVGQLWDVYQATALSDLTVAGAWLGVLAYTFQIYFDFSGYSDMATGLGRMLGFEFLPNFNYPYISRSVTEFWRRWHISLSTWFREYLYIPLGGNRCSRAKWMRNLFLVWAATGIWHGASWNFLLWGLYFWALLLLEKFLLAKPLAKAPAAVGHIYTMLLVMVSWAIFAMEDFSRLGSYLRVMFGLGGAPLADSAFGYYFRSYLPVLIVAAIASTPLAATLWRKLPQRAARVLGTLAILAGLTLCTAYLVAGTYNPFLYFRF